jgi:hypothetical protein
MPASREWVICHTKYKNSSKGKDALKRRFRLNKRAISTVLATVFFLGIAISVAVTLFLMSSTYNNLYQQQLQVREERLRERIQIVWWESSQESGNPRSDFWVQVENIGTVSVHVVSVYVNDEIQWNDNNSDVWISPLGAKSTPPIRFSFHYDDGIRRGDNVTVSTERGNIAVFYATAENELNPPGGGDGGSSKTKYVVNVQEANPQDPSPSGNPHAADVFRYQFWVYDVSRLQQWQLENLVPPGFDLKNMTGYNYSTPNAPEGFVGVRAAKTYAVWAVESQYKSNGDLVWVRVGPADIRPMTVDIPAKAETYVWVVRIYLTDFPISSIPPFKVTLSIIPSGRISAVNGTSTQIVARVYAFGPVGPSVYQNLNKTTVELTWTGTGGAWADIYANSQGNTLSEIDIQSPGAGTGVVMNGATAEAYWWVHTYAPTKNKEVTFTVTVSGYGSYDNKLYDTSNPNCSPCTATLTVRVT